MRKLFEFISNIWTLLALLPGIFAIVDKAKALFGSDKMQEFLQAVRNLLDSGDASPATPTVDREREIPSLQKMRQRQEQRRRFGGFMNRTRLFGRMPQSEVGELCTKYNIKPYMEDTT